MTMRDDVRTAFEKQQSALGDVGDAPRRLMREAMINRDQREGRNLQWVAAVAAVLIAAIVITTFALVKGAARTQVVPAATPSPRATPSPAPLTNELNVPDSTPIIVYLDPAKSDQVDGVTWDGKESGKITGGSVAAGNPANSLFGQGNQIVDRHGRLVATGTYGAKFWSATWADDEQHLCFMTPFDNPASNGVATTLMLGAPGQPSKAIARVGTLYNQTFVSVHECSVLGDRAIVVQSGGQGIGVVGLWVVQLSTGRIIWQGGAGAGLAASHDGMYVAVPSAVGGPTVIYGPDGKVAGHADGEVLAFSWDGSLAVESNSANVPSVVNWRTGQTIWAFSKSTSQFTEVLVEPGGPNVAVGAAEPSYANTGGNQPVDLYVIGPDGAVVFEKRRVTL